MVELQQQVADVCSPLALCRPCRLHRRLAGGSSGINHGRLFVELKPQGPAPGAAEGARRPAPRHWLGSPASTPSCQAGAEPAHRRALQPRQYQFVVQGLDRGAAVSTGRRSWPTPWPAIRTSPTSPPTCRTTPCRRRSSSTATRRARSASPRTSCARPSMPASAPARSRPSTAPATATR